MEYQYFNEGEPVRDVVAVHQRRIRYQVSIRRQLRDVLNPFDISVNEFMKLYRMPQHKVMHLVNHIKPYFRQRRNLLQIPIELMVLITLSFFSSGSYQRIVGRAADLSVCQASVSNIINEVTQVLNHPAVLSTFIRFPTSQEERDRVINRNARLGLPRTLGYIDGSLIKIFPPPARMDRGVYHCRKGFTAINAQLICNSDLYIMNVNARFPGSSHDSFIWAASAVRNAVIDAYRRSRCWLLGDSGYPEEPWLHTPLPHAQPGTAEYSYTRLHCSCRNVVERCIGVLKGRWRCLLSDRTLHYFPEKAGLIVNACTVLHNFCIMQDIPEPMEPMVRDELDNNEDDHYVNEDLEDEDLPMYQLALAERQYLITFAHMRRLHDGD